MTQVKKLFRKNQTAILFFAVLFLGLAILIPVETKDTTPEVKNPAILSTLALAPVPDKRSEVKIPILMYHHVRDYSNSEDAIGTNLSVSLKNFESQLDYLKDNGYTTITFEDFTAFPDKALPDKPVILTFDDGYDNNYTNAYKLLKLNGQRGVFYIISGYLGNSGHVTEEQVKEMHASGMEIGSHSKNHPELNNLSPTRLRSELIDSKSKLETLTGAVVNSLCYPAGKYNDGVIAAARDTGYKTAVTTKSGIATTESLKYELQRVRVNSGDSLQALKNKIEAK